MTPSQGPFEIESPDEEPEAADGPPKRTPPPPGVPHIDAESLLEGFEPGTDFDQDPEVQRALHPIDKRSPPDVSPATAELADPSRWMLKPGWPNGRTCVIVGGSLTLAAIIAAVIRVDDGGFLPHLWAGLRTIYSISVMTGAGLLAVIAAAHFSERGFNLPDLAIARLFPPVALGHLIVNLPMFFPGRTDEMALAGVAYLLALFVTFRLPRFEIALIAGAHFGIWMVLRIGLELARLTQSSG